jgi:hypothetical protein
LIRAQYGWRSDILYVIDRIDIVRLLLSLVRPACSHAATMHMYKHAFKDIANDMYAHHA